MSPAARGMPRCRLRCAQVGVGSASRHSRRTVGAFKSCQAPWLPRCVVWRAWAAAGARQPRCLLLAPACYPRSGQACMLPALHSSGLQLTACACYRLLSSPTGLTTASRAPPCTPATLSTRCGRCGRVRRGSSGNAGECRRFGCGDGQAIPFLCHARLRSCRIDCCTILV